jgi:hypothetical protein
MKLSATPQVDRFAKIARAIERGNDEVAAAVLNADRFFTDFLSDLELETLRSLWAKLRMPECVARLAQLESDLSHMSGPARFLSGISASAPVRRLSRRQQADQRLLLGGTARRRLTGLSQGKAND